jgi:phosphate transport system substrate-binding protein
MSTVRRFVLPTLLLTSLVLAACGTAAPATIEVTRVVAGTPETIIITATPQAVAVGSIQLNGAGATFPLPVYTEWTYAYQYVNPAVAVNYQGIGSGGGKKAIVDRTVDFAGSDSLLKDEEYTAGGDLQMYPMLAGAVVPIYNLSLPAIPTAAAGAATPTPYPKLVLDRETLVGIYDGTIKNWNDPAIAKLNPDLPLPNAPITVVHRSDGSGTTEIFTNALAAFSPNWAANVGAGSAVEWPVDKAGNGVGGKGNQGVAAAVQNTPNSIGYVELSYALSNAIAYAKMVNQAGTTVTADADSLASAMGDFAGSFDQHLTTKIVDGPGSGSWPIAGYTYLILHTQSMDDCAKAAALMDYIHWTLTDEAAGQRAGQLGYSVLPAAVRDTVLAKLGEVTCGGNPVMP